MTADEVKTAFFKRLPVTYQYPNREPMHFDYIDQIIYGLKENSNEMVVSARLRSNRCRHSVLIAESKYIFLRRNKNDRQRDY